jgi:hypothetical protein
LKKPILNATCIFMIATAKTRRLGVNLCMKINGQIKFVDENLKLSEIYNDFIQKAQEKYLAILPINAIFNTNWASELLYHYKSIPNSGCVGIRSQFDDVELTSTIFVSPFKDEDEMRTIWSKRLNVIDLPIFFEKSIISTVGLIDENINCGYEMKHFSFRAMNKGLKNYYVRNTSCLKVYIENDFLFPRKNKSTSIEFKNNINEIVKQQKETA